MVSFPYPKLMNANDRVDQGAALILCSVRRGPPSRSARGPLRLPPVGGRRARPLVPLAPTPTCDSSPAIRSPGTARSALAGIGIDDVAHVDLYSCFPCAVQIAATELGLGARRPRPVR